MRIINPLLAVFLLSFLILSIPLVFGSSVMWNRTYEIGIEAYSIIERSDGGYAIVGSIGTPGDFLLVRIDELGNIQWNKTYGGEREEVAYSLVETSDGGYALAGFTESYGQGEEDFWLVKTDTDGNLLWNRTYGGADPEKAYSLIETSDGGYALSGYMQIPDVIISDFVVIKRGADFWVIKTDSDGELQWNQTCGGSDTERGYSMVETYDGGYVVAGNSLLIKIDSQGETEWNQTYFTGVARALITTSDGGYAITGEGFLIKTDSNGNMQWNQTIGGTSLVATSDGGFAVLSGDSLTKTDSLGNVEWNERYETNRHPVEEWSRLNSMIETTNGGYAIVGDIFDWFLGKGLTWVIKTDNFGIIPEFHSWIILPLFITVTVSVIIIRSKIRKKGIE